MKIVCEFSGGADSVLATLLARERFPGTEMIGVFVNYGQVCCNQEFNRAFLLSQKLNIDLEVITVKGVWREGGMIRGEDGENKDVYTPCRNLTLLGCVIGFADSIEADVIITGSKGLSKIPDDNYSYYDSTIPFYKLMEGVWNYTTEYKRECRVIPILAEGRNNKMGKKEVYRELLRRGIGKDDTWSCFKGGLVECGECNNCKIKDKIFEELDAT